MTGVAEVAEGYREHFDRERASAELGGDRDHSILARAQGVLLSRRSGVD